MQYLVFVLLAPVSAVILLLTLTSAWRRRNTPGAMPLIWYLAMVAGFLVGNTLELVDTTAEGTLAWAQFNYLFIAFIPVTWLAYAFQYSGHSRWLAPPRFWIFCVEPVLTVLFAQTSSMHNMIWHGYNFRVVLNDFVVMQVLQYGPWFWVHMLYGYTLLLFGAFLIGREHFFAHRFFRRQSAWTVAGMLIPLGFNFIYVFRLIPGLTKDFSPVAFALAGLFFYVGIFKYRLLSLMPIARHLLVDLLPDGVVILDREMRVVDLNPTARSILNLTVPDPIGLPLEQVWPESRLWIGTPPAETAGGRPAAWADLPTRPDVMHVERGGKGRAYSLLLTPIHDQSRVRPWSPRRSDDNANYGWMLLLGDVTRRVDAERALYDANTQLRELNEVLEARVAARTAALTQRAAEMEALARISSSLRKAGGLDEMLSILLEETAAMLSARSGAIFLVESRELVLRARISGGQNGPTGPDPLALLPDGLRHPACADPLWEAVESGQMQVARGPAQQPQPNPAASELFNTLAGDCAAVVLCPFRATNHTVALLVLRFGEDSPFAGAYPGSNGSLYSPEPAGGLAAAGGVPAALAFGAPSPNEQDSATPSTVNGYAQSETHATASLERSLLAVSEMAGNALQRVRAMEDLEALVQARTRNLTILYDVTSTTNQFLEQPEMLRRVLGIVMDALGLPAGLMHLLDEDAGARPRLAAAAGLPLDDACRLLPEGDLNAPWQQVISRGSILVQPNLPAPLIICPDPASGERVLTACVALPVRAKGRLLGVMTALAENMSPFSAENIALLAAIADNTAVAIERAELRQRARDAAVMEERQRLSRDLHDSVTQSLYSLVLFAQAGVDLLSQEVTREEVTSNELEVNEGKKEEGEGAAEAGTAEMGTAEAGTTEAGTAVEETGRDKAVRYLYRVRDTAQQALREMRLMIFDLRPQALQREGLAGALRLRLESVERRAGIDTRLEIHQEAPLPDAVETALYGVAQEALNNVIKHAYASQVTVRLSAIRSQGDTIPTDPSTSAGPALAGGALTPARPNAPGPLHVELEITDNGRGIAIGSLPNPASAPALKEPESLTLPDGGVGFSSMRERIQPFGGHVSIRSSVGRGTSILVTLQIEEANIES